MSAPAVDLRRADSIAVSSSGNNLDVDDDVGAFFRLADVRVFQAPRRAAPRTA